MLYIYIYIFICIGNIKVIGLPFGKLSLCVLIRAVIATAMLVAFFCFLLVLQFLFGSPANWQLFIPALILFDFLLYIIFSSITDPELLSS